jgi:hypothetical protein
MSDSSMHPPRLLGAAIIALGAMVAILFFSKDRAKVPQDLRQAASLRSLPNDSTKALSTLSPSSELQLEPSLDRIDSLRGLPDKEGDLARDIPKLPASYIAHGKSLDTPSQNNPSDPSTERLQASQSSDANTSAGLFGAGRSPARVGVSPMPAGLHPLEGQPPLPPGVVPGKGLPDFSSLRSPAPPLTPLAGASIPESNWSPTGQTAPPPSPHAVDLRWRTKPARAFPTSPSGNSWGADSPADGSGAIQQPRRDR